MSNHIYLSPRKILSYLCDLERKIQRKQPTVFQSAALEVPVSQKSLNAVAQQILFFVGLGHITPQCVFGDTNDNTGGFISDPHTFDPVIRIIVSRRYQDDSKACLAILAHEICHRVISLHGIRHDLMPIIDEIYTDLCTIYIGLGRLILDGYKSKTGRLGYLEADMYMQSAHIMQLMGMDYGLPNPGKDVNDLYLEDAFELWQSNEDKSALVKKLFMDDEQDLALTNRNILLLQQILDRLYTLNADSFKRIAAYYEPSGLFSNDGRVYKLRMFSAIYESLFCKNTVTSCPQIRNGIYRLIMDLNKSYPEIEIDTLKYNRLRCPSCGKEVCKEDLSGKDAIFRCPSCGLHFRSSHTRLNIIGMQRDQDRIQREEEIKRKVEEAKREALELRIRRNQQLIEHAQEEKAKTRTMRFHYKQEGVDETRQKYSAAFNSLPAWLRWLLRRYGWSEVMS